MIKEIWKDVVGYDGCFMVSNLGNIKSLPRLRKNRFSFMKRKEVILKPNINRDGYSMVCLSLNGKRKLKSVHRLVAIAFLKNPENKRTVNHINGIKNDNRLENLEWATDSEQINHAIRTGLKIIKTGKNNKKSIPIKQLDKNNNLIRLWDSTADVERELGIKHSNICKVLYNKRKYAGGFIWSK